jgi:mono/diheme cytochrome c family protein
MLNFFVNLKFAVGNMKPLFVLEEENVMKKFLPLVGVCFVLVAVPLTLMAIDSAPASDTKEMAAEPVDMEAAKITFETTCSKCHSTSRPLGKKKDQAGWESTVERMSSYHKRQKGKEIPEEDRKAIVQYLLSVAGK